MSRRKLAGVGSCSALFCSLALGWSTTTAATEPAGPMLIGADNTPAAASTSPEPIGIREARRLLIDLPGGDPIANAASELLLFGPATDEPSGTSMARRETPRETSPAKACSNVQPAAQRKFELSTIQDLSLDDLTLEDTKAPTGKSLRRSATKSVGQQAATPSPATLRPVPAPMMIDPAPGDTAPLDEQVENLPPEMLQLCDKVRTVLARYYHKHQSARLNSPWEVMHAIIGYGVDTQIYRESPGGDKVNAIAYMCYNYPCADQRMLLVNRGKVDASRGVGVQGHGGQFLAILAQSHVKNDYPMLVEGKQFTLQNLIEREMETCVSGEELTFKLIALAHYLDPDATWTTPDGQKWSIERLVREELRAPVRGAACGGTHRLMGYSYAVKKRAQHGKPITGDFLRAQKYLQDYHRYTFSLQNPDGSFSTAWFERRANEQSIDRKLKTTGHILEWLTFSLSDEEIRNPRTTKAVDFLATIMLNNDRHTWEIGPQGHAVHALLLYEDRMFKNVVPLKPAPLVDGASSVTPLEARRLQNK